MTRPYVINGGGGGSSTVEIINQPVVEQLSESSVKITVTSVNIAGTPTSYKYYWEKFNNTTLVFDAVSSKTDGASTTITGLVPLGYYMFKVEAYDQ
jgi:tRNA A37 threonylcarbamoyladenosine synthetase subunit TsaC/SUA5/YrdC